MFVKDIKGVAIKINSARTDRIKLLHILFFKTEAGKENSAKLLVLILKMVTINFKLDYQKFG